MKIAIDGSRYGGEMATGVEWYSFHIINALLEELKGSGDEVAVYSREKLKLPKWVENRVLPAKRLWTLKALSRAMCADQPEALFVPSHVLPPSLPKRSVIMIHDVAFRHFRKAYGFRQYHYLNWSTKFAVKNASAIVVPSEATKKDLVELFACDAGKIEVVPHGFAMPDVGEKKMEGPVFEYFEIDKTTKYILFVGRLEAKKNLVRLVEAFGEFVQEHEEWKLVLAGKRGVGFHEIQRKVTNLGLAEKVVMPGYVTEEEKQALLENCHFFAFPSLYEGFGFPVLEAFSFGKAVLTSQSSSLPEVAGAAAHYVDPLEVSEMAAGLEKLASDEAYVKKLVSAGQGELKKFSWKKAAEQTLKVIHGQ